MSDKFELPNLDLPGQKTHWSVVAVVGTVSGLGAFHDDGVENPLQMVGVLVVLLLAGVFFLVVNRQQASREAAARELEARAKEAAAQVEKMKLEAQLFTTDGQIADYSISHFVPGSFRFHVVRRIAGA